MAKKKTSTTHNNLEQATAPLSKKGGKPCKRQASNVDETVNKRPKTNQDEEPPANVASTTGKRKQPPKKGAGKVKTAKKAR